MDSAKINDIPNLKKLRVWRGESDEVFARYGMSGRWAGAVLVQNGEVIARLDPSKNQKNHIKKFVQLVKIK